jgi:integrase/recombinase XerD
MSSLRGKYIRDMAIRGLAERTQVSYTVRVAELAAFYNRSPKRITYEEVADWLHSLVRERKLAASTVNIAVCAVRFLYAITLRRDVVELMVRVPRMKRNSPRPEVYACSEMELIIGAALQPRDRALLVIVYACGLRLLEAVRLKVTDIDRARMQLRVRHGKGNKERVLPINQACLQELEAYWRTQRKGKPQEKCPWLFLGTQEGEPMCRATGQNIYYRASKRSKVRRKGGIHTLRHSFATHCLENEIPITLVQQYLGHSSLATTARYLHVTTLRRGPLGSALNLIDLARTATRPAPEMT